MRARGPIALLAALLLAAACAPPPEPLPAPAPLPEPPPPASLAPLPCDRIVRVEIHKGARTLRAFCELGAIVEMTAALGREPGGPKQESGDLRTPEGSYRVAEPARDSRFHLFIALDYPSLGDAEAALAAGRISRSDHSRIVEALEAGELPPGNTPLGGDIGIHGEGRRWQGETQDSDWTLGCVAVSDEEIEFLGSRLEVGTPVEILP